MFIGFIIEMSAVSSFFVYIIECIDGSYYTGYSKDVQARFQLHKKGKAARYTRMHKPWKIVFTEGFPSRKSAMKREKQIKKLTHNQKHILVSKQK